MAYTLVHKNPISNHAPSADVIVDYDDKEKCFCVTRVTDNITSYVLRQDILSANHMYEDLIIHRILMGFETDDELSVLITPSADNQVHLLWAEK